MKKENSETKMEYYEMPTFPEIVNPVYLDYWSGTGSQITVRQEIHQQNLYQFLP